SFQHTPAAPRDGYGLNEAITLRNVLRERSENCGVALACDLVDHIHEPRMPPADPGRGLYELCCREREPEHHHHVQSIDVHPVGHHRGGDDDMEPFIELWLRVL